MNRFTRPVETLKDRADEYCREAAGHKLRGRPAESDRCAKEAENYRDAADVLEEVGEPDTEN